MIRRHHTIFQRTVVILALAAGLALFAGPFPPVQADTATTTFYVH